MAKASKGRATPPATLPPKDAPPVDDKTKTRVDVPPADQTPKTGKKRGPYGPRKPKSAIDPVLGVNREQLALDKARWRTEGAAYEQDLSLKEYANFASEFLAARFGDRWRFTDKEIITLCRTTGIVVAKHAPKWLILYAEEFAFVGAVLGIIGTRVWAQYLEYLAAKQEQDAKEADAKVIGDTPAPN